MWIGVKRNDKPNGKGNVKKQGEDVSLKTFKVIPSSYRFRVQ